MRGIDLPNAWSRPRNPEAERNGKKRKETERNGNTIKLFPVVCTIHVVVLACIDGITADGSRIKRCQRQLHDALSYLVQQEKKMLQSVSPRADQGQPKMAVSYREAGQALGVCERVVWQLVKDGKLKAIRIGRSVRIPVV